MDYNNIVTTTTNSIVYGVITAIAILLAITTVLLLEFLVVRSKNAKGGLKLTQDFITSKINVFPLVMRVLWIFSTVYVMIHSFVYIPSHFGMFILNLVLGPIISRTAYEFLMSVYETHNKSSK